MSGGELREQVRFERRSEAGDDGYGNKLYAWTTVAGPLSARIKPARGSEEILAQKLSGVAPVEIKIRYHHAVTLLDTGDRCVDVRSGTIYNITSISNDDEHGQYLNITAQAGVAT